MVVGEMAESVDLVVVGGGPGGYAAAVRGAQHGRQVTLVDADEWTGLGGTCLNVGCIPSKALIRLAEGRVAAAELREIGLVAPEPEVDLAAFQRWKSKVVAQLTSGVAGLMKRHGITVVQGRAMFNRPDQLVVSRPDGPASYLQFTSAVIATGSTPVRLPELPVDGERVIDSTGVLALDTLPRSVVVVGAGYIGLELALALARLGARVSLVEVADRLLPMLDDEVVRLLLGGLRRYGVALHLSTRVVGLIEDGLAVAGPDGDKVLEGDRIVVAAGRRPLTDELGLSSAGLDVDSRGFIRVDESCLASPTVAAIGDVTDGPALAHRATAQAEVAVAALGGERVVFAPATVPAVLFTDPEIAYAGLSVADGVAAGLELTSSTFPTAASGRASTLGVREGFVRLVHDSAGTVVGGQVVGPRAEDLIAEITLAIEVAATVEELARTIHVHPTLSEQVAEAAEVGLGTPLHGTRSPGGER